MSINDFKNVPQIPGIYYFKNRINGKYYIGQTENLKRRLKNHIWNFKANKIINSIYNAFRKYGLENFEWGILEYVNIEQYDDMRNKLDEIEKNYIQKFNTYANGYNQTYGGDRGIKGYKFTKQQSQKVGESTLKRAKDGRFKIYYYDVITKEYGSELTLTEFNKKRNMHTRNLKLLLINHRYIIARTKETLEQKIKIFENNGCKPAHYKNLFKTKLTEEMIIDIKNGMRQKDFINKYHLSKNTYISYKKKIYKEETGKEYKRIYPNKVDIEEFKKYRKSHNQDETAAYFKINKRTVRKYDKMLRESDI